MAEQAKGRGPTPSRADAGSIEAAVASLPWLAPTASSMAAWCRSPSLSTYHAHLRHDPAAVLLLLRTTQSNPGDTFPGPALEALAPLEFAQRLLAGPPRGFIDWNGPESSTLYRFCHLLARTCQVAVARAGGDSERAWVIGLLAPLGQLVALSDRRLVSADPLPIARRFARLWLLPPWLASAIGSLDLPWAHARRFGADPLLFSAVRLAIAAARDVGFDLGLGCEGDLSAEEALIGRVTLDDDVPPALLRDDPYRQPLLLDLLAVAQERGRLKRASVQARLERENDDLHAALAEQTRTEAARLHESKLTGLAEFAAGAGHEINNPLAIISGQAQYLLAHRTDWFASDAKVVEPLEKIIAQTKRIHGIIRELMLFARPAPARLTWLDLPTLMGEVASSLGELARQRQVRVEVAAPDRFAVYVDGEQVKHALSCLLRNAIEAVAGGWARLRLEAGGEQLRVCVEDSGPGPNPEQVPTLFDPFFCGRSAGRGKGLGLPVAWRLARQQGGDLYLELRRDGQPTRFVMTLPAPAVEGREAA